jgi:hypothetical protein
MSNETNPFEAAIAALEARRIQVNSEIDADITKLKEIGERMAGVALTSGAPMSAPAPIEKDTFYNLSFPEAAKKYLGMVNKKPQSTNAVIDALAKGGLSKAAYNTMYATLSRRSKDFGDIINVNGDWALPEWYGQKPKSNKKRSKRDAAILPDPNNLPDKNPLEDMDEVESEAKPA